MDPVLKNTKSFGQAPPLNRVAGTKHFGGYISATDGCYVVFGGQDGDIDYTTVLAAAGLDDTEIEVANQDLPAGTIWNYVLKEVSGCGLLSDDSQLVCEVVIGSDGEVLPLAPNPPLQLRGKAVAGGNVELRWRYSAINQAVKPDGFNIYYDGGQGPKALGDDGAAHPLAALILHFDGNPGETPEFGSYDYGYDVSLQQVGIAPTNETGDITLDDTYVKFGSTSAKLAGFWRGVTVEPNANLSFGNDEFLVMFRVYITAALLNESAFDLIFMSHSASADNFVKLYWHREISGEGIKFEVKVGGVMQVNIGWDGALSDGWNLVCVARDSAGDIRMFVNGDVKVSDNYGSYPDLSSTTLYILGVDLDMNVWYDEYVILSGDGACLYSSNFTPPTLPFGSLLGQVNYRGQGDYPPYITEALEHGQEYHFRVCSYTIDGGESQNDDYVRVIADAIGPAAIESPKISWEEI